MDVPFFDQAYTYPHGKSQAEVALEDVVRCHELEPLKHALAFLVVAEPTTHCRYCNQRMPVTPSGRGSTSVRAEKVIKDCFNDQ
jgi:hypothetical protein